MKAEIISIGTEILLGEILDTNAQYIASRLPALGIDLYYMSKVGDNMGRLVEVIERAWNRSDLIITTGGLGPTEDDLTREAIATVLGEELYLDPEQEQVVRSFFARRGFDMPERNLKQAMLIPSARPIANPRGTAPGWWVERDGKIIVAMPGVPVEMTRMWDMEVTPRLQELSTGTILITRTIKTTGLSEARVDELVSHLLKNSNPSIGVYARADGIHLRLGAKAETPAEAWRLIRPVEEEIRLILGPSVWGTDDETMEQMVGQMLAERGLTLATMESCTGGLLASTITDVPGSSQYFKGGLVSYATEMKIAWGVDPDVILQHGVISAETAVAMAAAARRQLQSDIGIGITGVAGPDSQEGQPPGTVHIAVDYAVAQTMSYTWAQDRLTVKRRAVTNALMLLRRAIVEREQAVSA